MTPLERITDLMSFWHRCARHNYGWANSESKAIYSGGSLEEERLLSECKTNSHKEAIYKEWYNYFFSGPAFGDKDYEPLPDISKHVSWDNLFDSAHENAVNKGFWENARNDGEMIALMHSELSELLEAVRKDGYNTPCEKDGYITQADEEAADLFIRLADYCKARGINLKRAAAHKTYYNSTREYKHGKKF